MIKVCHLTSVHRRYDVRIFEKECKSLAQNGYDVTLIVNDDKSNEIKDGVSIISTGVFPSRSLRGRLRSGRLILRKALEQNGDIYHIHDPELLVIARKLKKKGKKVVFDSHEFTAKQIMYKEYIPIVFRKIISKIYERYETRVLARIDGVIVPCTYDGENYFKNKSKKVVFVDNFPLVNSDGAVANVKNNTIVFLAGTLSRERGIVETIIATAHAKIPLVLAGKFSSSEFEKEVKALNEYENVKYLGIINKEEVDSYMKTCKIGISLMQNVAQYPHCDNLATKILEYLSYGIPVICSNFTYTENIMKENQFGITVNPSSIDEIVNAITFLIDNPEKAVLFGKNGRELVIAKKNWGAEEKKLLDLYKSIMM